MVSTHKYNIDLCKGTGLIQETVLLLDLYQQGMLQDEMTKIASETNLLAKNSTKRISDIVKSVFYKRFVNNNQKIAAWLQQMVKHNLGLQAISQLLLIYTSRANAILSDFIINIYWPAVRHGVVTIDSGVSSKFIQQTISSTDLIRGWSSTTQSRMAGYLISTLVDFRLLDGNRNVLPFFMHDTVASYLAHELHFTNHSDAGVVNAPDWALFGYSTQDTISHLERLSFKGYFIFQNSGELVKIGWKYQSMEEFINDLG